MKGKTPKPRPMCRHCGRAKVCRPRGLCWSCYYRPGVRDLYPSTSKFVRRGCGVTGSGTLSRRPTAAQPGTPEKIRVLQRRAAAGLSLWHPRDWSDRPLGLGYPAPAGAKNCRGHRRAA